jgi:hypothetical protein
MTFALRSVSANSLSISTRSMAPPRVVKVTRMNSFSRVTNAAFSRGSAAVGGATPVAPGLTAEAEGAVAFAATVAGAGVAAGPAARGVPKR